VDGLHAAGRVDHDYTRRSSGVITMPGPSLTGAGQIHRPESASLGSAPHRKPGSSRRRTRSQCRVKVILRHSGIGRSSIASGLRRALDDRRRHS
jgi:hypothetical protein